MVSSDYEDLFSTLNTHKIKYLVVGAHAVMFYTEPRFTKDLDIWIPAALNEPQRVYKALKAFGAPLRGITPEEFNDPKMILQIGVAPVRIDILTNVPGVNVEDAWKHKTKTRYGRTYIYLLGQTELIQSKKTANRPQDKLDLKRLSKKRSSGYRPKYSS
ncbi:MAG: nucleotidyltransferase [Candidatus Omnitrophica bacterium]|nr:nucleotidyltransferase [Candidatus Omnitrophota bacterium]